MAYLNWKTTPEGLTYSSLTGWYLLSTGKKTKTHSVAVADKAEADKKAKESSKYPSASIMDNVTNKPGLKSFAEISAEKLGTKPTVSDEQFQALKTELDNAKKAAKVAEQNASYWKGMADQRHSQLKSKLDMIIKLEKERNDAVSQLKTVQEQLSESVGAHLLVSESLKTTNAELASLQGKLWIAPKGEQVVMIRFTKKIPLDRMVENLKETIMELKAAEGYEG